MWQNGRVGSSSSGLNRICGSIGSPELTREFALLAALQLTSKSNPITNKAHKHQEIKQELQEMIPYKANTNNYKVITRIYNFFF